MLRGLNVKRVIVSLLFSVALAASLYAASNRQDAIHPFLSMADIHFNPLASCADTVPCPLLSQLQEADVSQWQSLLALSDQTPIKYGADTNYPLFKLSLAELKKQAVEKHVQFVVVLGDYLSHNFRIQFNRYAVDASEAAYQAFVKKTLRFIMREIALTFPSVDVYAALGNNDSYLDDYVFDGNDGFFNDMADNFSALVKDRVNARAIREEFPKAGYYSVNVKSANLHLIVLNANIFSAKASGVGVDAAAQEELAWLQKQLEAAHRAHDKVLILQHLPNAVDVYATLKKNPLSAVSLYRSAYEAAYQSIVSQYSSDIAAILTAHFHSDWFQIIAAGDHPIAMDGAPALSILYNNAAYKVYEYNSTSQHIEDFQTYFYDVLKQNGWAEEYDFNALYQPDCTSCNILDGMKNLQKEGYLSQQYIDHYTAGVENKEPITTKWLPYYWCQVKTVTAVDYEACRS